MSDQNLTNRQYLNINQLSEISGFSVTQIRRLVDAQKIPYFQPGGKGGKLLFPPNALERNGSGEEKNPANESNKPLSGRRPKWTEKKPF